MQFETKGSDCEHLGGTRLGGPNDWAYCNVDICEMIGPNDHVFALTQKGNCSSNTWLAYGIVMTLGATCTTLGGRMNSWNNGATELVQCHLDACNVTNSKSECHFLFFLY